MNNNEIVIDSVIFKLFMISLVRKNEILMMDFLKTQAYILGYGIDWCRDYAISMSEDKNKIIITQGDKDYTFEFSLKIPSNAYVKYDSSKDEHYLYAESELSLEEAKGRHTKTVMTHHDEKAFIKSLSNDEQIQWFIPLKDSEYDESLQDKFIIDDVEYSIEAFKLLTLIANNEPFFLQRNERGSVVFGQKLNQDGQIIKPFELTKDEFNEVINGRANDDFYDEMLAERPLPYQYNPSRENECIMIAPEFFSDTVFKITKDKKSTGSDKDLPKFYQKGVKEEIKSISTLVNINPYIQSVEWRFDGHHCKTRITDTTQHFKDMTADLYSASMITFEKFEQGMRVALLKGDPALNLVIDLPIDSNISSIFMNWDIDDKALALIAKIHRDFTLKNSKNITVRPKDDMFYCFDHDSQKLSYYMVVKKSDANPTDHFCKDLNNQYELIKDYNDEWSLSANQSYLVLPEFVSSAISTHSEKTFADEKDNRFFFPIDENNINLKLFRAMYFFYRRLDTREHITLDYKTSWDSIAKKIIIKFDRFDQYTIDLHDPKTWSTLSSLKEALDKSSRTNLWSEHIQCLLTMLYLSHLDNLKFELNTKNELNGQKLEPKSLAELQAAFIPLPLLMNRIKSSQKGTIFYHNNDDTFKISTEDRRLLKIEYKDLDFFKIIRLCGDQDLQIVTQLLRIKAQTKVWGSVNFKAYTTHFGNISLEGDLPMGKSSNLIDLDPSKDSNICKLREFMNEAEYDMFVYKLCKFKNELKGLVFDGSTLKELMIPFDIKSWQTLLYLKKALPRENYQFFEDNLSMIDQHMGIYNPFNYMYADEKYHVHSEPLQPVDPNRMQSSFIIAKTDTTKSTKPSMLPHTLLPSAVVLSAIFVSTGVIAMPIFSIALMTASALGALALQVAIYQNNTQNKGSMLQNPWVSHNTLAFGLALIAYLSLMTNPLAALIAISTIMTLAPLASVISQSLFAGNEPHIADSGQKLTP